MYMDDVHDLLVPSDSAQFNGYHTHLDGRRSLVSGVGGLERGG